MVCCILFFVSLATIVYAMVGYPIVLKLLDLLFKPGPLKKKAGYNPSVTLMITAHNEEKVILKKLENTLQIDYPSDKFEVLVASDFCTDDTDKIVEDFIAAHPGKNIRINRSKEHKGKTNAQNESQKTVSSEILVMTDANSMLKPDAVRKLTECFADEKVAYVCGRLSYQNSGEAATADSESTYWNLDLYMRDVESRFDSITAGNGALYACRNALYHDFSPIESHDAGMPPYYRKRGYKAVFEPVAVATEKAGEQNADEFKRKVRMNRDILQILVKGLPFLNIFKYGWYSIFYTGHRTCRYSLWLSHLLLLTACAFMAVQGSRIGIVFTVLQLLWIMLSLIQIKRSFNNKWFRLPGYYGITILAQIVAVWNIITGKTSGVWEKAESTR